MNRLALLVLVAAASIPASLLADTPAEKLLEKPDSWYRSDEGRATLDHVLSWQTAHGDWPKNQDTTLPRETDERDEVAGTFDNGATSGELRVLARAFRIAGEERYEAAFLRGFDHILAAQYPHGGWPQFFPLSEDYHGHVTFNDGTMIRLMEFLRDAAVEEDFAFLDSDRRAAARRAVARGVECIVKCQVVVNGAPTVWCAQHHAETFAPVQARSYELPSLSGAESAGILTFLMRLEKPSPEVIRAVDAGAAWFDAAKIEGYRFRKSATGPALTEDSTAPPLWARFYEIESNRPIFSDRDGVVKYDLDEVGSERRGGYTWYGTWGANVLKKYAEWRRR